MHRLQVNSSLLIVMPSYLNLYPDLPVDRATASCRFFQFWRATAFPFVVAICVDVIAGLGIGSKTFGVCIACPFPLFDECCLLLVSVLFLNRVGYSIHVLSVIHMLLDTNPMCGWCHA